MRLGEAPVRARRCDQDEGKRRMAGPAPGRPATGGVGDDVVGQRGVDEAGGIELLAGDGGGR